MVACEVDSRECREHEIGDFTSTSQVNIPKGEDYAFSFYWYDRAELVATQERAITRESGITSVTFLCRRSSVVSMLAYQLHVIVFDLCMLS